MFIHNFFYSLKVLFKNKMLIFWTFAFPLILGTFFNMAFSNIENSEKLDAIDIAVVESEDYKGYSAYKMAFDAFSSEDDEDRLFNLSYVDRERAKVMLDEGKIAGFVEFDESPKVVIMQNGIDETILKKFVEEVEEQGIIYEILGKALTNASTSEDVKDYESFYASLSARISSIIKDSRVDVVDNSPGNLSYTMIEFYTLIAMTCIYGGILGVFAVNKTLANMSSNGKRVAVSPTPKFSLLLSSICASYTVQLIGLALLFAYTIFALNVDYGNDLARIVILSLAGCLAGLTLGIAVASVFKTNEDTKTGIVVSITMLGCFFSGMMGITMKYIIDKYVPLLNAINPANMITDGLYALYYYGTHSRFNCDVISLLAFSAVMTAISFFILRRQKYDSI